MESVNWIDNMNGEINMYEYKKDIFDMFSKLELKSLQLFCDEINTSQADVFVIMANKAVCLFNILLEQNYIDKHVRNKILITNRALEYDCTYLSGKKVAVIDDIIISGTAISLTVNKLIALGIPQSNINVIAIATDKKYFSMNFADENGNSVLFCNSELEDETCIALSYDISKSFLRYGLPCDVDFPIYAPIVLEKNQTNLLFNDFFWDTNNITSTLHENNNIDCYTLIPKDNVLDMVWRKLGFDLSRNVHLKLRVNLIDYPNKSRKCQIIPMCLFDEILEKELDEIFYACCSFVGDDYSYIAKVRYLQYFISHNLYLIFLSITSISGDTQPEESLILQLFGLKDGEKIFNSINKIKCSSNKFVTTKPKNWNSDSIIQRYQESDVYEKAIEEKSRLKRDSSDISKYDLNRIMLFPFIWWYDTKEIPIRNKLKQFPKHYISDYTDILDASQRLNYGFSLSNINDILCNLFGNYCFSNIISIFLDRSIDEGIIVPTIYHDETNQLISRVYRHGEDLPFALEDECRLLLYIQTLAEQITDASFIPNSDNCRGIPEIAFEKIIVLFYQIGLRKGDIFNRFLGFDNTKLIMPFLSLHGKISGIISQDDVKISHFYSERDIDGRQYIKWLSKWLEEKGFVKKPRREPVDEYYFTIDKEYIEKYLSDNNRGCLDDRIVREIKSIANIISTWYISMKNDNNQKKFKDDSIALTSCSDQFVFSMAIATEIHYFYNFWKGQVKTALENYSAEEKMLSLLTQNDFDKKHTMNIVQALNSGRNKVEWFYTNRAINVVAEVSKLFDSNGSKIWNDFWDDLRIYSPSRARTSTIMDYTEQAIGYLYFYSACYDCIVFDEYWMTGKKPKYFYKYRDLFDNQCEKNNQLNSKLFSIFDKVDELNDINQKLKVFIEFIEWLLPYSEDIVNNIENPEGKEASYYTVKYNSSLLLEFQALDESLVIQKIMEVWNMQTSEDKTQLNIIKFAHNQKEHSNIRYGVFYGISGSTIGNQTDRNRKILIEFYNNLSIKLNAMIIDSKAILIPFTPTNRRFKHNVFKNISVYTKIFDEDVYNELKEYFKDDSKQQLLMVLTNFNANDCVNNFAGAWSKEEYKETRCLSGHVNSIIRYYYEYVKPSILDYSIYDRAVYSTVKIQCGTERGTGFLLRTDKKIVCVSCNHVFQNINSYQALASSQHSKNVIFSLSEIKPFYEFDYKDGILDARKEIAIYEPEWKGNIIYDYNYFLTVEDFSLNIYDYLNSICTCCGYPDDSIRKWSNGFKLIGKTDFNYYQTRVGGEENDVGSGYSGGLVFLENNKNCIIGFHEGRTPDGYGLIIPSYIIKEELERLSYV